MKANAPLFVVVNAGSGRNATEDKVASLRSVLEKSGRPFEVLVAQSGGQVPEVARRAVALAKRADGIVVVAGGDGTINAVGQVALEHELPFGVVPEGTFNYLSRGHGIPQDPTEAVQAILDGRVKPVQAGLVNDRVFFVNASLGLYPRLLEDREAHKRRYGRSRLVAVWSALVTLLHQTQQLEIDLDADGSRRHLRTPTLFVANNRLQLEQVGIVEAPELDQDRLVAITAKSLGMVSSLRLMLRGFLGKLGDAPEVTSFAFETLTAQIGRRGRRSRVKVATDGEVLFMRPPLTFQPSPHALQLIVPPEHAALDEASPEVPAGMPASASHGDKAA
ncbi:MAG: NAD(+)/NADH kinase [Lautropia sp.]|nr:NAD(+)/NADH kinase [Lautropia sp.]